MYSKDELDNIEGWRGFLALTVFVGHLNQILWDPILGENSFISVFLSTIANLSVVFFL